MIEKPGISQIKLVHKKKKGDRVNDFVTAIHTLFKFIKIF